MELKNIKANFLGDSITSGCGVSSPDKVFHALIKENTVLPKHVTTAKAAQE